MQGVGLGGGDGINTICGICLCLLLILLRITMIAMSPFFLGKAYERYLFFI